MSLAPEIDPQLQRVWDLDDWAGRVFYLAFGILFFGIGTGVVFAMTSVRWGMAAALVGVVAFAALMMLHNTILAKAGRQHADYYER